MNLLRDDLEGGARTASPLYLLTVTCYGGFGRRTDTAEGSSPAVVRSNSENEPMKPKKKRKGY